jgi:Fe-S-cluster containining protein
MVLSNRDIKKIKKKGVVKSFYVEDTDGWLRLRNEYGRCVFHDGRKCTIYQDRPQGCALYPVVYDADAHMAILDLDCPQRHTFPLTKHTKRHLFALVSVLERERNQRQHLSEKSLRNKK